MSRGGSSWYRRELRAGRVGAGNSAAAFGAHFSSGPRASAAESLQIETQKLLEKIDEDEDRREDLERAGVLP